MPMTSTVVTVMTRNHIPVVSVPNAACWMVIPMTCVVPGMTGAIVPITRISNRERYSANVYPNPRPVITSVRIVAIVIVMSGLVTRISAPLCLSTFSPHKCKNASNCRSDCQLAQNSLKRVPSKHQSSPLMAFRRSRRF